MVKRFGKILLEVAITAVIFLGLLPETVKADPQLGSHYHFNDGTELRDYGRFENDLTKIGTPDEIVNGYLNEAFHFESTTTTHEGLTASFSAAELDEENTGIVVDLYAKTTAAQPVGVSPYLYGHGSHTGLRYKIDGAGNIIGAVWEVVGFPGWITESLEISGDFGDGQWHRFVGTYNPLDKVMSLEVDGSYVSQPFYHNEIGSGLNPVVAIGCVTTNPSGDGHGVTGDIDEVKIYTWPMPSSTQTLTIQVNPNPDGPNTVVPDVGSHNYDTDTRALISGETFVNCPDIYKFNHWEGNFDVSDANSDPNSSTTTVLMDTDRTITAVFVLQQSVCGDLCHPILQEDFSIDCLIDFTDFAMIVAHWLECSAPECD